MKSKRVLEYQEIKAKAKQLKAEIRELERHDTTYARDELKYHLEHFSKRVVRVRWTGAYNEYIHVVFHNNCELFITQWGDGQGLPRLSVDGVKYVTFYNGKTNNCFLDNAVRSEQLLGTHLAIVADVFPDVCHILRNVVPNWPPPELDAESLMTMRVLHWIAQELPRTTHWPDIIVGHVVDKFQ